MKFILAIIGLIMCHNIIQATNVTVKIHITDNTTKAPISFANIFEGDKALTITDSLGNAALLLTQGNHTLIFSYVGYKDVIKTINVPSDSLVFIVMDGDDATLNEVTISSTRNNNTIENSPMKIEVLGKEEMNEENGIKPASITGIIGDISGIQIQQTSAVSGNSNVRIQGLDGKYTQILRDGMPLYDGFSGSLGLLSIPPLDLQQVELIKGSASTLYGGGAIGGLVNLISKKPGNKQEADVLVNYTTLREFNGNVYVAKKYKNIGYTLYAGYNNQLPKDVNKDGFSDVSKYQNGVVHPKLFFYIKEKTILSLGYNGTIENRIGGDMNVLKGKADSIHQFFERNQSQRHTGDFFLEHYFNNDFKLIFKGVVSNFANNFTSNTLLLKANQISYYQEASIFYSKHKSDIVAGINFTGDALKIKQPDTALIKSLTNNTIGIFAQHTWHINANTILESGLRIDVQTKYGALALPRLSVFHRFNTHWAIRGGMGMGYKTPNPFAPQLQDIPLDKILPPANVKSELSFGANAEFNYKYERDNGYSIFINQSFYYTQISRPLVMQENLNAQYFLQNKTRPIMTGGSDTYIKCELKGWELYFGYTYNEAHQKYLNTKNNFIPITPRHRFAFVLSKEWKERYRIGIEGSFIGKQYRMDYSKTPPYFLMAAMASVKAGRFMYFVVNCENMLNYTQSKVEPLYTGTISAPQFKPLWAPIDGWVMNVSIRFKL